MKKRSIFLALLLLSTSPALADVVIGETCTQLGASQMTTDQEDIATCLKDGNELKWKGMTKSASTQPVGGWCGYATVVKSDQAGSNMKYKFTFHSKCGDQQIFALINPTTNSWGTYAQSYTANCPDGYALKAFRSETVTTVGNWRDYSTITTQYTCLASE